MTSDIHSLVLFFISRITNITIISFIDISIATNFISFFYVNNVHDTNRVKIKPKQNYRY